MKGVSKVDTLTTDEGYKIDIKLNKKEGEFQASFDNIWFKDKDLSALKNKLVDYSKSEKSLKYEPVIEIGTSSWNNNSNIGFEFRRYFRAKKADETFLYREFVRTGDCHEDYDDLLEGTPGSKAYVSKESKFITYTPDKWKSLRYLQKQMGSLRNKLKEIITGDKAEEFLEKINNQNIKLLEFDEQEGEK